MDGSGNLFFLQRSSVWSGNFYLHGTEFTVFISFNLQHGRWTTILRDEDLWMIRTT